MFARRGLREGGRALPGTGRGEAAAAERARSPRAALGAAAAGLRGDNG